MKLRYRRTILVGFAFLAICAFWQMYDNVIPLILTETFHLNETLSGAIMAADNVLALFLLPLFGALSDRTRTRFGKRMPYIFAGTILAVMLMNVLPVLDNAYFRTPTSGKLAAFVAVLGLLLVAMGLYRSPAVALMPDVTPKPLRSRGNAVINLMGALGGILYLLAANVLYSAEATEGLAHVDYQPLFLVVGGIMLLSLLIQVFTIREEPMAEDVRRWEAEHPEQEEADGAVGKGGFAALPREVRRSLFFLLLSIALWFIGYNGVTTWFTTYASQVWGMALGEASGCLMLATGGAIVSYLPVGAAAARVGRKRTIAFGVVLLAGCFLACFVYSLFFRSFSPALYVLFALVGLAWAAINVNSLPMVVEMCRGGDIGKFTGYYYSFSMAAQIITPIAAGWLLRNVSYHALFLYAGGAVALALLTMSRVRHGDSRPARKKGLENFDVDD